MIRRPCPLTNADLLTIAGLAICLAIIGLMIWMGACRSAPAWGDIDDSERFQCRLLIRLVVPIPITAALSTISRAPPYS